jgi:hypothetical protein
MRSRVTGALRAAWNAGKSSWFSALPPLPQVAPPGTPVRRYDFQLGQNLEYFPRSGEPTTFAQLRALADHYDLLRLVIETRKDQLGRMPWKIVASSKTVSSFEFPVSGCQDWKRETSHWKLRAAHGALETGIRKLETFFQFPDGEHSFSDWLRTLAEDLLVLDAPAIEPVLTRGGELAQLQVIDGATIFPVIAEQTGFTPAPPAVAYQQIIKGVVAAEFTADELIYRPRNRRTHKLYGFGPVEQVVMTVNLALRRQMSQLAYYTDGTVPDAYLGVTDQWTPEQVAALQQKFDEYLAGNARTRRKMFVGPDGKLTLLKQPDLKGDLDEWLARVVCFAFSISPQPFVREMNRATAETAKSTALEEGLRPLLNWFADLFNLIIRKYFGITDAAFEWQDDRLERPGAEPELVSSLVAAGVLTPNEARQRLGLGPVEGGDRLIPPRSAQQSAVSSEPAGQT